VTRYRKGFAQREWHKTRPRNEALDCRQYAYAALKLINPNLERIAKRLTEAADEPEENAPETPPEEEKAKTPQPKRKRLRKRKSRHGKGSSWVNNY
jgi:phage terminase large subunit GpA-like protein